MLNSFFREYFLQIDQGQPLLIGKFADWLFIIEEGRAFDPDNAFTVIEKVQVQRQLLIVIHEMFTTDIENLQNQTIKKTIGHLVRILDFDFVFKNERFNGFGDISGINKTRATPQSQMKELGGRGNEQGHQKQMRHKERQNQNFAGGSQESYHNAEADFL